MKIIFVAEMQDPYKRGSSTQIMTLNLLKGLKNLGNQILFIAITDKSENMDNICFFFKAFVDEIICVESRLNLSINTNKYIQLLKNLHLFLFPHNYSVNKLCSSFDITNDTIVISHNPPFEAARISRQIKKQFSLEYYQYWSDPYALSGILPEKFGYKRYLSYLMEACFLSWADRIIYGTQTLGLFQRKMFPLLSKKMRYVDVSYSDDKTNTEEPTYTIGYFGGYNSRYRNILPVYQVIKNNPQWNMLICGKGIPPVESCSNIKVYERIAQNEIYKYENQAKIHVTMLNFNNIQIPGKIFYKTNQNITILIILDGKYKNILRSYLEKFERFEFCENTEKSIKEAIDKITTPGYQRLRGNMKLMSQEKIAQDILDGGLCL